MNRIKQFLLLPLCLLIINARAQVDTFATLIGAPVNTAGWNLVGQAKVSKIKYTDSSEVLLCPTNTTFTSGGIFYNQPINLAKCSRWVADFDFRIFDGNAADGLTFCFLDKPPAGFVIGQGLGIPQNSSGLKVCFDTWNNCNCNGAYQVPKLEVRWGTGYTIQNPSGSGATCWDSTVVGNGECNAVGFPTVFNVGGSMNFIRSDAYNHATIKYNNGVVTVLLNGNPYVTALIPVGQQPLFAGYLGFTSATGSNYDNHSIRNVIIKSDIPPSDAGPAKTICSGKAANLGTSFNAIYTYKWTPSTDLSSDTLASPVVKIVNNSTAPITRKYYVNTSYDVASTCSTIDSVIVTVNPYPHLNPINGNKSICINKTSQLSNDSTGGTWLTLNTAIASITNTGLVNAKVVDTTTVRYIVTNNYSCTDSVSALLNVRPIPVIDTIAGIRELCATHAITMTNDSLGGVWSSITPSVATINNVGVVSGLAAGLDTIRYTVTTVYGCVDSVSTFVKVNSLPVINAIAGNTQVCKGKQILLTDATPGGVWLSVDTAIATIDNTGKINAKKTGTVTIRYMLTNANGCSDSVSTSVTVNPLPTINSITGNNTLCFGKTTQLSNTTGSGIWVSTNDIVASVNNTGIVTGNTAGSDTVRYIVTNSNGCVDSVETKITVNPLPVIAAITGTNALCFGKTTLLSNTTSAGSWSSTNPSVATVDNTGKVTAGISGTATIRYTVTNSNGCTDSVSTVVTVNSLPVINAIGGTNSVCIGKTTQLTETTGGGSWINTNNAIAIIDITGVVTGATAGIDTIRYIVTNGNGCTDSVYTLVTVKSPSSSSTALSICPSDLPYTWNGNTYNTVGSYVVHLTNAIGCDSAATVVLSLKPTSTSTTNTSICPSVFPYTWNGNTYNIPGTYTVHLTNSVGCDSAATIVLSSKPTSTSTTNTSICPSAFPYSWNGNSYNAVGSYTVHLTSAIGCDSAATLVLSLKPTSTSTTNTSICPSDFPYSWNGNTYNTIGSYTVHLTNAVGCDSAATLVLSFKSVTTSSTSKSVCPSDFPYTWNGNNFNAAGSYVVHLTNAVGCDSAATLVLSSKAVSTSTTNTTVCTAALPYNWNGVNYNAAGAYTYHTTNAVGCDSTATLNLTVNSLSIDSIATSPALPILAGANFQVQIVSSSSIDSAVWTPAALFSNHQASQSITAMDTSFWVSVTGYSKGCQDTASKRIVVINTSVYIPNAFVPATTGNTDVSTFKIYGGSIKTAVMRIYNQWGQLIKELNDPVHTGWDGTYSGQMQPTGVYVYTVKITYLNNKTETKSGSINLIR